MADVLGVDLNGVIVENITLSRFILPGDRFFTTKPIDGAFEALVQLR